MEAKMEAATMTETTIDGDNDGIQGVTVTRALETTPMKEATMGEK